MRYEGQIYRPPSEADAYIVQATVGCSWNHCTYCDMYRSKVFRVRSLRETLTDIEEAGRSFGRNVSKVFVADGDALVLDLDHWEAILAACRDAFPRLKRVVSAYATAMNVNAKRPEELRRLRELGLSLLYMGPETGDDPTFKRIAKGSNFEEHVEAARRAHEAGMKISAIFLLGAGGTERSKEHAAGSAKLITEIDPEFVSALTLTSSRTNAKRPEELRRLRELGLSLLYMGPETGDDPTFRRIAKGSNFEEHVEAARRAHEAGMKISAIFLLGAGGTERSKEHAAGSAKLITEMDPEFVSALTLTIIPGTPIDKMQAQGKFTLPSVTGLLEELRTIVAESSPANAVFRTNHASNYLPLAGRLPEDRERIVAVLDEALAGGIPLRPESSRGL